MTTADRRDELTRNLAAVRARISTAATAAGRDPDEVTLVAVTKFFPATDVRDLVDLGVHDVGENRDQEAREKFADPALAGLDLTRHFIGQLQTNKAASVASYADVVHTADRPKLVLTLAKSVAGQGKSLRVLVQVSLDQAAGQDARGGIAPDEVPELADLVAEQSGLVLGGVMAVAPLVGDPQAAFARLRAVSDRIRSDHPEATWMSAGMSGDLEAAVQQGATHLRVGSAILGMRPALR